MSANTSIRRRAASRRPVEKPKSRIKVYALMITCLLILISGFFLAARQHFASIDYSIRNSRLRRQLDELEAEKRRLMVAREVSLSPAEIRKAAKKFIFSAVEAEFASMVPASSTPKEVKPAVTNTERLVKATVSSAPVRAPATATVKTPENKSPKPNAPSNPTIAERSRVVGLRSASTNTKRNAE